MDAIAIVGMSCRFPGARDLESYWQNLANGVESLVCPSDAELLAAGVERAALSDPAYVRVCARLEGIDQFDAPFFKIAAREAELMDPQHRVFLECAFEALEDSGCDPARFAGEIGVFAGATASSYWQTQVYGHPDAARWPESFQALLGNDKDYLALFTSYKLGLRGPSLGVQTACSTSLVALHMACASLRERECDAALCGGVTIRVPHPSGYRWAEGSPFSKSGRCRPFDASADGTVFGSGAAALVVRRLEDALADGDPIRAIVLGSAVNNDGALKVGFTAPSEDGQARVLAEALALAEVSAESVQYIEAHGTGTPLGDPIELAALRRAYAARRAQPCWLGSVKGNIGHLEAAAGMAGLFKAVLALEHEALPPSLHVAAPNPADGLFEVVSERRSWLRGAAPRRAGVSSFGIGGTNAHVVLEEAPLLPAGGREDELAAQPFLVPLSAHDATSLRALASSWRAWLSAEELCDAALRDVAYTSALRRRQLPCRAALVAHDHASLVRELQLLAETTVAEPEDRKRPVVLVFPGSGVRWRGAGQALWQTHAAFTQSLKTVAQALRRHGACDVIAWLTAPPTAAAPGVDIMQPCLFALEVALAAQWRAWGVVPDAVVGHSLGEVAAAHVAGALSLDAAAQIVVQRSVLLKRLEGCGEMAVVALSEPETRALLGRSSSALEIAALNGPCATVVAGPRAAIALLTERCARERVACRELALSLPFHSQPVEPLGSELAARLAGLRCRETSGPELWSSVTASKLSGAQLDARYWARNLRETVRFAPVIAQLAQSGPASFVEVGPHPSLLVHMEATLSEHAGSEVLPTLRAGAELSTMLRSAAALFAHGVPLAWSELHPSVGRRCVRLPRYPWQRQRYWMAPRPAAEAAPAAGAHELLGARVLLSTGSDLALWQAQLSAAKPAYLADHKVGADSLVPATAFLAQALTAAAELYGRQTFELHDIELSALLPLPEQGTACVQTTLEEHTYGTARFTIKRLAPDTENTWTTHCTGGIRSIAAQDQALALDARSVHEDAGGDRSVDVLALDEIRARCRAHCDREAFYRGLSYGPVFRGVEEGWRGDGEALVRVRVLSDAAYEVHPATLDACLQSLAATLAPQLRGPAVPVGLGALTILGRPERELWCHARLISNDGGRVVGDITACDAQGTVVLRVRGLSVQLLAAPEGETPLLVQQFRQQPLEAAERSADGRWVIVSDRVAPGSVAGDLARALELRGGMVSVVAAHDRHLLAAFSGEQRARALLLVAEAPEGGESAPTLRYLEQTIRAVQELLGLGMRQSPRVYFVTRRAQAVKALEAVDPEQAAVWGLRRSLAMEHPELRCTAIDLASADEAERGALTAELLCDSEEEEVALRADARWVGRLAYEPLIAKREARTAPNGRPYRLELDRPGSFDGLQLRACERRAPGAGEVELQVCAAGLNFIDVVKTLGLYPGLAEGPVPLGEEVCGRIVRVGPGVTRLKEGQEVFGLASGAFGAFATTREDYLEPRPAGLSQVEAASVPVAFLTAAYALNELARLRPGERVLIHSAASGTGLAALQLAQRMGARVLATAGTEEKRALLRGLGVEHVFDSRAGTFAASVMKATAGEGVDVVLNALAGAAIEQGLSVLAEDGRFVELGKRDLYAPQRQLSLGAFRRRVSFHVVDLTGLAARRPERIAAWLRELAARFSAGALQPLPVQARPIAQVADALQSMSQGRHIGKLAITLDEPATIVAPASDSALVRADATYLISGGLGALGLVMARWLVDQGATTLVLLTRQLPAQESAALTELRARAAIHVAVADVADRDAVERVVHEIARRGPPLRGVIHAAGVIEDAVIARQDLAALRRVLAPKALGAWNLHVATRGAALDFMVGYGSAVGLLGAPGQGAYAAANCYLSALAQLRHARGLPGLVVEWGPFGEVGMGARARLGARGLELLSPAQSPQLIAAMLRAGSVRAGVVPFDVRQWIEFFPQLAASTRLAELLAHAAAPRADEAPLRRELAATTVPRQPELVVSFVRKQVSELLRIDAERVGRDLPLLGLGVDSLVGLELRNRLARACGLSLPTTLVWTYATVAALAEYLLSRLRDEAPPAQLERAHDDAYASVEGDALLTRFDAELAALEEQV